MTKQCLSNATAGLKPSTATATAYRPTREREGKRRLSEYLSAPAVVQEAFDKKLAGRLNRDLELERRMEMDFLADDPIAIRVAKNRRNLSAALGLASEPARVRVRWNATWSKRAKRVARNPGQYQPYDRASDPLRLDDLRDLWPQLTGEDVPRHGRVTCPHPDHEDHRPDCHVFADGWRCYGCNRHGDIIDLGGFLYGIRPVGSDFHRIRERLLGDLGMEAVA